MNHLKSKLLKAALCHLAHFQSKIAVRDYLKLSEITILHEDFPPIKFCNLQQISGNGMLFSIVTLLHNFSPDRCICIKILFSPALMMHNSSSLSALLPSCPLLCPLNSSPPFSVQLSSLLSLGFSLPASAYRALIIITLCKQQICHHHIAPKYNELLLNHTAILQTL